MNYKSGIERFIKHFRNLLLMLISVLVTIIKM